MSLFPALPRWLRLNCSAWLYPGPRRVFTPQEMASAGNQPWPVMLHRYVWFNALALLGADLVAQRTLQAGWMFGFGLAMTLLALAAARTLWRQPTRARLNLLCYGTALLFWLGVWAGIRLLGKEPVRAALPSLAWGFVALFSGWWALTVYRFHQIEARLRELAEQDAALRLSTRLAAAQIQPHFLFNTLASLQHWVDTGDARAAPLLRDFTAYLRATLPMFERELHPLADELDMVRHYLAILQTRLGARLAFTVDAPGDLKVELPPGLLLTLAENAITHGIEPALHGGRIDVRVRRGPAQLELSVQDDGPGLAPGWTEGTGLQNTRRRLLAACPGASLTLADTAPGCLATLTLPA